MTAAAPGTESPVRGLLVSAPAPLPSPRRWTSAPSCSAREAGNVLIYSAPTVDAGTFADAGAIARVYLNHRHEAAFGSDLPAFRSSCTRPSRRRAEQAARTRHFSRRHTLDGDLEVIPTPGHTPGATAYLWDSGQHRFLFTGDTIYLCDGDWIAAVLDSSDRAAYLDSLKLIRDLEFDVLVPWAATAGDAPHADTSNRDARHRIDAIIDRLRRGEDR